MRRLALVIIALLLTLPVSGQTVKILGRRVASTAGTGTATFVRAFANVASYSSSTGTTIAAPATTVNANSILVVLVTWAGPSSDSCSTDTTISDDNSGTTTWTQAVTLWSSTDEQCQGVWYSEGATGTANASTTVTATFSPSKPWRAISVAEFGNVQYTSPSDATATSSNATTAAWTTGTINTAFSSGDLLVGLVSNHSGTSGNNTPGSTEAYDGQPLYIAYKLSGGDEAITGTLGASTNLTIFGIGLLSR